MYLFCISCTAVATIKVPTLVFLRLISKRAEVKKSQVFGTQYLTRPNITTKKVCSQSSHGLIAVMNLSPG